MPDSNRISDKPSNTTFSGFAFSIAARIAFVVSHAYIEEKMTPLNIWLVETDADRARAAIVDYGCAIKELAANDVFAGDLLWKNFGVTRAGRLVLYDYDEICPLLSCKLQILRPPSRRSISRRKKRRPLPVRS